MRLDQKCARLTSLCVHVGAARGTRSQVGFCHTAYSPDGIRVGDRDGRTDYDTFHNGKSMYTLKSDGIEDDGSEKKHHKLRVTWRAKRSELQLERGGHRQFDPHSYRRRSNKNSFLTRAA